VPNDEAARHPMLERLDAFVGEWSIEASFGPDGTGRAVYEWVLGGQFLMERSEVPDVPEAPDGIAIIGVDRDGEAYTQHYFDSRGVTRVYAMSFKAGVWELSRRSPDFSPLNFSQRFKGRFSRDAVAGRAGLHAAGLLAAFHRGAQRRRRHHQRPLGDIAGRVDLGARLRPDLPEGHVAGNTWTVTRGHRTFGVGAGSADAGGGRLTVVRRARSRARGGGSTLARPPQGAALSGRRRRPSRAAAGEPW